MASGRSSSSNSGKMMEIGNVGTGGTTTLLSSQQQQQQQQASSITGGVVGNIHCSIGQQPSGNTSNSGGLAPIMEIREMNSYCNSCVGVAPEKYWNPHSHHHHPHHPANVSRHTAVYPQMFYTPPPPAVPAAPPPPPSYASTTSTGVVAQGVPPVSNDWSCAPPTADSYSHFIYSQYPAPPPPPPPSQHHDYSNFLSMSTSCYESDMMMMSSVSGSTVQNGIESSGPVQAMMNSFMYPSSLPPQLSSFDSVLNSTSAVVSSMVTQPLRAPVIAPSKEPLAQPPPVNVAPASPTTSGSSTTDSSEDSEEDEDDDSRNIIRIEDDENDNIVEDVVGSPSSDVSISSTSLLCVLCKKPASLLPVLPPNAPSPQLSRILDNIDDDELDISVCSGDIEIGGIEDEMIQQATEHQQQRISLQRLSQMVGVTVVELTSHDDGYDHRDEDQGAVLCSKCYRLVGMADSLEKQLISVISTLRQAISLEEDLISRTSIKVLPSQAQSVAMQTDNYDVDHTRGVIQVRRCGSANFNSTPVSTVAVPVYPNDNSPADNNLTGNVQNYFLCHQCGRHFSCRKNLGKHLKRQHHHGVLKPTGNQFTCSRENCGKVCADNAALKVHLRKHTSDKPYFCLHCLKLFTTKSNLTAHVKANICQNNFENTKTVPTPEAPVSDLSISNVNSPNVSDTSPSFHCENCGLSFRTESRFQRHISNKDGCNKSKLFECPVCSKPFAKRSELRAHQVVHTRAKSFVCDICGMAFGTRGNQRVHQRTHFQQKRFKCLHCDKGFTRNHSLQTHITNAHNNLIT